MKVKRKRFLWYLLLLVGGLAEVAALLLFRKEYLPLSGYWAVTVVAVVIVILATTMYVLRSAVTPKAMPWELASRLLTMLAASMLLISAAMSVYGIPVWAWAIEFALLIGACVCSIIEMSIQQKEKEANQS